MDATLEQQFSGGIGILRVSDGFSHTVFRDGTNRVAGNVDTDAFANYLAANPGGITLGPANRIVVVP